MALAKLTGEDKHSGMVEWISHRKELWVQYKILAQPKTAIHITYRWVLQEMITPEEFEEIVRVYHRQRLKTEPSMVVSIDGKSTRGAIPYGEQRGVYLLAVYVLRQAWYWHKPRWIRKKTRL